MPTTQLPEKDTKAHEIARKIANQAPRKRDRDAPEQNVTGGFNQQGTPSSAGSTDGDARRKDGP